MIYSLVSTVYILAAAVVQIPQDQPTFEVNPRLLNLMLSQVQHTICSGFWNVQRNLKLLTSTMTRFLF